MAVDFGILSALRSRDDWGAIKQEKQKELQYQSVINSMLEDDVAEQEQKQQAIQQYMDVANKLEVLPSGMDRIKEQVDEPLKRGLAEKIKKYGGDLDKYWKVEGQVDMQNYLNQLLNNPTTVREMMNASAAARWQADKQAGRQEVGEVDPLTGQLVSPFEQKLHEYNAGNIDKLDYEGAFDLPDFDTKVFQENYGDPKDPYRVVPVGGETFRTYAFTEFKKKGLDDRKAKQAADMYAAQYGQALKQPGFQPYTFKHDKRPQPTASWGNDQNAYLSAKANVDQWDAITNPNYDKWIQPKEVNIGLVDEKGKSVGTKKGTMVVADMVPIPIGKKTITYDKQTTEYDAKGNVTGYKVNTVTEEVEDAIEPIMKIGDKKYIQTTADRLQGKKPTPLESKSFNKMWLAIPNTPEGLRVKAAYRKALGEKGLLNPDGTVNFDLNNPVTSYVDTNGNEVDLEGATQEQIDQAISSGIIKQR